MSKIKIAPSTKTGAHHWLMQRVSAVALIPLVIWISFSLIKISQDPQEYLKVFFSYPFNAIVGILFISTSLYHGSLGMRVIIEDYISNKTKMHFYIMLVHFVSITTAVAGVVAILRLHLIR
ncbi:MAG: succinate dehydrogenase, hydrophobic membrane anchor protein [Proteobacteria bacterium]|nr:succinate dehydrogenase, hydrophobic membrane anchor protein [Pseudomonadota bacterium]